MDEKRLWFSNFLLLGFDTIANERKFKISFNRSMFDLPNMKGLEVVLHFIFHKLDPEKADADFRDCWPVYDKKQGQSFRRVCSQWFAAISRDDPRSGLPRQGASLLLFPEGKKLYNLLVNFTYHCLKVLLLQTQKKLGNKVHIHSAVIDGCGNMDPALTEVYDHFVAVGIVNHTQHVVRRLHTMNDVLHPQWRQYAQELVQDYRHVLKLKNDKMKLLSQLKTKHSCLNLTNPFRENEREAIKLKVNKLWKEVDAFIESTKEEREVLKSVLKPSHDCHVIDGKNLQYKVPDEVEDENTGRSPSNEPIDLTSLVFTGNECLSLLQKQLNQGVRSPGLVPLQEELEFAQLELSHHKEHMQSAQFTRTILTKLQEDLKKRIIELQQSTKTCEQPGVNDSILRLPASFKPDVSISLAPPASAPPIFLDTSASSISSTPLQRPSIPHRYADSLIVSTPTAIGKISSDVLNKHRTRNHSDLGVSSFLQKRHTPYNKPSKATRTRIPLHTVSQPHPLPLNVPIISFETSTLSPTISLTPSLPTITSNTSTTSTIIGTPLVAIHNTERTPVPVLNSTTSTVGTPLNTTTSTVVTPLNTTTSTVGTPLNTTTSTVVTPLNTTTSTVGTPLNTTTSTVVTPLNTTTSTVGTPLNTTTSTSTMETSLPVHNVTICDIVTQSPSLPAVHYTGPVSTTGTVQSMSTPVDDDHEGDTTIDRIADKIADLVCSEDTPYKNTSANQSLHLTDYEAFTTREKLLRTPSSNADTSTLTISNIGKTVSSTGGSTNSTSTGIKGHSFPHATPTNTTSFKGSSSLHAIPTEEDNVSSCSSSSSDFNLLSNEVPPTPYREIDLTPGIGMRTGPPRNLAASGAVPPLILLEDSD